jgi:hypothetical protein
VGLQIRPSTREDLDAIASGFAHACGKPGSLVAEKVRWALGGNPAGSSGVVAVDPRGEIVAHLGVSHVPMRLQSEDHLFGRVYGAWVDPILRVAGVHGPFQEIDGMFRETYEGTLLSAIYGTFAELDWWTLRRTREFVPIRTDVTLRRAKGTHRAEATSAKVARATPDGLAAWTEPLDLGACASRRDGGTTAFRTGGPYASDVALIASVSGRPAGLAIFRDLGPNRVVLDFAVPTLDEDCARALFDHVIGDGSREVRLPGFTRSPWFLLAQRKGFRAIREEPPYLVCRPAKPKAAPEWLMEHWCATAADMGLLALPSLLAAEEIVTSAPIGTLAGRERNA